MKYLVLDTILEYQVQPSVVMTRRHEMSDPEDKILQVARLIGKDGADSLGGGIRGFIIDLADGRYLMFGYADGPLGYDLNGPEGEHIESGQMDCEELDALKQAGYIQQICRRYGKEITLKE